MLHEQPHCSNVIECDENPKNLTEEVRVLVEAIRLLTKIVTTANPSSAESLDAEKQIELLHSKWRLEDTGFPKLLNACKQMQDALGLTSLEADRALDDMQRANEAAARAKVEEEKKRKKIYSLRVEKKELQKKNQILVREVEDHKKQKKLIARSIRKFVDSMKEQHSNKDNTSSSNNEKNFPQLEYITSASTSESCTSSSNVEKNVPHLQYVTSVSTSEDSEDPLTGSSALVTDEGCATIRFTQRQGRKIKRENGNFRSKKKIRQRNVLELSFPSKNVGIQFTSVSKKYPRKKGTSEALLVCGFMGFDDSLNRRPTFGARLVCIDGISIEREEWNMENFIDYICAKSGPTQMSFRNEFLTTAQIAQLKKVDHLE